MPVKLLESGSRTSRSVGGALTSAGLHTAFILGAVYATAHARSETKQLPTSVRTVYFPHRSTAASPPSHRTEPMIAREPLVPRLLDVPSIDIKTHSIELSIDAARPEDFGKGGITASQPEGVENIDASSTTAAFRADQVERQVALVPGSAPPEYPEMLRRSAVEGTVVATFIVGDDGHAEIESLRFLRSDNRQFEDAVRAALRRMRFVPAEVAGRKVRQLVQMPFVFTLAK
jgi:protein TonB